MSKCENCDIDKVRAIDKLAAKVSDLDQDTIDSEWNRSESKKRLKKV